MSKPEKVYGIADSAVFLNPEETIEVREVYNKVVSMTNLWKPPPSRISNIVRPEPPKKPKSGMVKLERQNVENPQES